MHTASFVKIPDGGLSGLVELTWNEPMIFFSEFIIINNNYEELCKSETNRATN